ncbi:hypothetical protein EB796_006997 [Bugula neritina]|uniref:EGF-like domain-containing protein n=1 Tax=Bugula neritina TaxID=10212 RepID=A0A7J7KAV5_BUGNE|nr:hypothetical protein EB796_006997 [Bugula neritina]
MAKCTDIDDREDESSCGHICINSPGSYVCACNSGYELNEDESTCDVNYLKTLWDRISMSVKLCLLVTNSVKYSWVI